MTTKNVGDSEYRPFFSIGVMTYNRWEMLKETINSILWQTFTDFEVIVGNDYTKETLSSKSVGIEDPRVRFVNHHHNLGEMQNMNSLMQMSNGKYFTWLADDDMYMPTFLESVHASLVEFDFPHSVFTSYVSGATFPDQIENPVLVGNLMIGRQFLQQYLNRKVLLQGYSGVFDIDYIRGIGGIIRLGKGFGPYSDNLLAIKSGLLEKLVYIDAPLFFFRTHEQSISWVSTDLDSYVSAQDDFLHSSTKIFRNNLLLNDFHSNLFLLLTWCIGDVAVVIGRSGYLITRKQVLEYIVLIKKHVNLLKGSDYYWKAIDYIVKMFAKLVWPISRQALLRLMPNWIKHLAKSVRNKWHSTVQGNTGSDAFTGD